MTTEQRVVDPYDAVLADLRAKRDEIDKTIRLLENVRGISSGAARVAPTVPALTSVRDRTPRAFGGGHALPLDGMLSPFGGMTIPEATKKLLTREQRHMTNPELAEELKRGGLVMNSDDPANTIGSVLKRRQEEVGDLIRINPGRGGKWGLAEWNGEDPVQP